MDSRLRGRSARWLRPVILLALGAVAVACSSEPEYSRGLGGGAVSSTRQQTAQARQLVRGMMGLPAERALQSADPTERARAARYEAVAERILDVLERDEPGTLARFGEELSGEDRARAAGAWSGMRGKLQRVAESDALADAVRRDEAFSGVRIQRVTAGGVRVQEVGSDGVPILGRGPDGRFGDGREGPGAAAADTLDGLVDPFTPWRTLGRVDRGELEVDPESRLGAYAATRGYPPGSVGAAVHNAIGTIYILFGNYGQERIGRVFNSPEARALYGAPVESPAGAQMAAIEARYWQNVRAEDQWSPGGQLGSAFSPVVRDWLQRNVFSTGALPAPGTSTPPAADGGGAPLSKTDCGDKTDGWWCFEAGTAVGWMVYCKDKQILSGCGCGACGAGTGGTAASCSAAPPPAACPN
jgi:hypothetical protein